MPKTNRKAWVVAVDMGYGHQRAAYPLKDIAHERIINANSDKLISPKEKKQWHNSQKFYEWLSRGYSEGIAKIFFRSLYKATNISPYYLYRDESKPTIIVTYLDSLIKKGLGKSAVDFAKNEKLPFISTFYVPAIAAAYYKLKNVYCVVTDVDINRIWVAKDPKAKIIYLAPTQHTVKRLTLYGVPKERIFLTGFPLPKENLGGRDLRVLKKDIANRLPNLDPNRVFIPTYNSIIKKTLGRSVRKRSDHPLTVMFAVGGAGAQTEIAIEIVKSLRTKLLKKEIIFILSAGLRNEVKAKFEEGINKIGLKSLLGKNIKVIFAMSKKPYFEDFNKALRNTDILWTKPSELSFYTALGLPIILSEPIGPHEEYNQKWLIDMGSGHVQEDPRYTNEWLFDWIDSGRLAESAWKGFLEAPKLGTYNIEDILFSKKKKSYFEL